MKVLFVGMGSIGKRHLRNLAFLCKKSGKSLHVHLLRSSSRPLESEIQSLTEQSFYHLQEIDSDYDAIFITNPTFLHYDIMFQLREYSEYFFVEKPVFHTKIDDISAFENGNTYYVACPLRYTNIIQKAKEILSDKNVFSVRALCSSYLPEWRTGVDYRTIYSANKEEGGGVQLDLIHEWDYLTYLFGFPQKTFQLYGKYSALQLNCEDIAVYIAQYQDKLIELHLDYFGRQTQRYFEVITEDGVYLFDFINSCIRKDGLPFLQLEENPNDKYIRELEYFLSICYENAENLNSVQHANQMIQLVCSQNYGVSYHE